MKLLFAPIAALGLALGAPAQAQNAACHPTDLDALSGWNGVWLAEGQVSGLNGRALPGNEDFARYFVFGSFQAPWNAEGRKRVTEASADPDRKQEGWGFPVMMAAPTPFEIVVGQGKTAIVGEYRDIRVIYTDGREHDEDAWPTIYGESLGCWKGDTLEVTTTGVHYTPEYNAAAPPLSDDAVFHETLRLVGPDTLQMTMRIEDPATLEKPWEATANYFRHKVLQRLVIEGGLEDNNRVVKVDGQYSITGAEGGLAEDVPSPGGD